MAFNFQNPGAAAYTALAEAEAKRQADDRAKAELALRVRQALSTEEIAREELKRRGMLDARAEDERQYQHGKDEQSRTDRIAREEMDRALGRDVTAHQMMR